MEIPFELHNEIVKFLTSLPNIHDRDSQRAFLFSAGLDSPLMDQISIGGSTSQFFQILIPTLVRYGTLRDGRNALVAVLETAKQYIGQDKKVICEELIQKLHIVFSPYAPEVYTGDVTPSEYREIPNPFIYGNPIRPEDAEVFVGRLDIVERIKKLVMTDPKPTLFLYGRRRSGKTSTLLNLHRFLGKDVICVFLDMQDARFRESSEAFCRNLSEAIVAQVPQIRPDWKQLDFTQNPFSVFAKFLDILETVVTQNNITLLLTLDEYERLDTRNTDILDTLRTIIQHRRKIIVLVAGSHRFEDIKAVSWSDYLINTQLIEISWLDPISAQDLITKPVKGFDLEYPNEMPQKILALTHCQPYLLQAVASELVNHLNLQKRKQATDEDLEEILKTVLTAAEGYFVNYWAEECTEQERDLLEELILAGTEYVTYTPTNKLLRFLLRKEILERKDNNNPNMLHFAVPLFKRWIKEKQLMMDEGERSTI